MWIRLIIIFFLPAVPVLAKAQNLVTVQVVSNEGQEPVVGAYVYIYPGDSSKPQYTSLTDADGLASLPVSVFPATIEINSLGYDPFFRKLQSGDTVLRVVLVKRYSSLEEVVVTGVTAPVRMKDALSTYQVITKASMEAQGAVNVADALRNQLNEVMSSDGVLGSRTSMQGMKGDKVKILVDGIPLSGREGGEIDLGQINLNNVERIEVVQGPMSVVYGTDALGGVINIITRKNNIPWRLEGGALYESLGRYNFDLAGTIQVKQRHQFSLGGGRNYFDGWRPLDTLERSFDWKPKEQYLANFAYGYTARSSFRLQFASDFVHEKITNKDRAYVITPFYARARDEYYRNLRSNNRISLSGNLGQQGKYQLQNAYKIYRRIRNTYNTDLTTLHQELSPLEGMQDTTSFTDIIARGSYTNHIRRLEYTFGYDINLQEGKSGKIPGGARQINDYAGYLSFTYPLLDSSLRLQPALRYAKNSVYDVPLVPSMSALYSPSEAWQFRLSWARGFRAPSLKELYLHFYDSNHEVEGNPDLKPEQGDHIQASASWTAIRKESGFLKLMLTGYHNDVKNQISLMLPDSNSIFAVYTNIDRLRNLIGTLQVEGQWKDLYMQTGYSLIHLLETEESDYATSHQITTTVQYFWKKPKLSISAYLKHLGKQPNLEPTIDGGTAFNGVMNAYTFLDLSVNKRFWKNKVQLTLGVKNLLDVVNPGRMATGVQGSSVHGSAFTSLAAGRSLFTSLRLNLQ